MGKIRCIKCNEEKGVRADVYEKRIRKYGSEEKLLAEYKCRKCRPKKGIKSTEELRNGDKLVIDTFNELKNDNNIPTFSAVAEKSGMDRHKVAGILKSRGLANGNGK